MFEGKGRNKSEEKKDYKYISCVLIGYNFIQLEHIRTAIIVNPVCIKKTLKPASNVESEETLETQWYYHGLG